MDTARNTNIIKSFQRCGFVMIAVPALIVAIVVGLVVRDIALDGYGGFISAGMNSLVGMAYQGEEFAADGPKENYETLDKLVKSRKQQGRLTEMTALTPEGIVVYSTQPELVGQQVEVDSEGQNALEGNNSTSVVWSDDVGIPGEPERYLQVVSAIHYGKKQVALGYLIMYRPYELVSDSINRAVGTVVAVIFFGAVAAYSLLMLLARAASREVDRQEAELHTLESRLAATMGTIETHSLGTLQALSVAVDAKDSYTARHSLLVADYACMIAARLEWDVDPDMLERAGLLHDIGKIGVPEAILSKPDLLKAEEYQIVQEHSEIGADIIRTVPSLADIIPAVLHHHERWDGRGYPAGLAGESIPASARILAAADAFDAMTSDRPYRPGLPIEGTVKEIEEHRGTQFDPEVADVLLELIAEGAFSGTR